MPRLVAALDSAAAAHDRAAALHERAAALYDRLGRTEPASRERGRARADRDGAITDHERARLRRERRGTVARNL